MRSSAPDASEIRAGNLALLPRSAGFVRSALKIRKARRASDRSFVARLGDFGLVLAGPRAAGTHRDAFFEAEAAVFSSSSAFAPRVRRVVLDVLETPLKLIRMAHRPACAVRQNRSKIALQANRRALSEPQARKSRRVRSGTHPRATKEHRGAVLERPGRSPGPSRSRPGRLPERPRGVPGAPPERSRNAKLVPERSGSAPGRPGRLPERHGTSQERPSSVPETLFFVVVGALALQKEYEKKTRCARVGPWVSCSSWPARPSRSLLHRAILRFTRCDRQPTPSLSIWSSFSRGI